MTEEYGDDAIIKFWRAARSRAVRDNLAASSAMWSPTDVPPPAWAFGDNAVIADELVGLVLDGVKTATSSALAEYEDTDEPLPKSGDLSIILDGEGQPQALIRTTHVEQVPFNEVTEDHAHAEGEDDQTLESWRSEHEKYWRRVLADTSHEFDPNMLILLERFELLYPERH